jgi:uncharacterized protein (DUF433 family)
VAITHRPAAGRIVRNPGVLGGEPIVRGTRLAVRHIALIWRERGDAHGVVAAYPQLSEANVQEAVVYYADHQVEIDNFIVTDLGQE